jgi:hypothetical protein
MDGVGVNPNPRGLVIRPHFARKRSYIEHRGGTVKGASLQGASGPSVVPSEGDTIFFSGPSQAKSGDLDEPPAKKRPLLHHAQTDIESGKKEAGSAIAASPQEKFKLHRRHTEGDLPSAGNAIIPDPMWLYQARERPIADPSSFLLDPTLESALRVISSVETLTEFKFVAFHTSAHDMLVYVLPDQKDYHLALARSVLSQRAEIKNPLPGIDFDPNDDESIRCGCAGRLYVARGKVTAASGASEGLPSSPKALEFFLDKFMNTKGFEAIRGRNVRKMPSPPHIKTRLQELEKKQLSTRDPA